MSEIIEFVQYNDAIEKMEKEEFDKKFELAINENDQEANMYYYKKRVEYEIMIQTEEEAEWKNNWGIGFWFVLNEYKTNSTIKDYMAKKMLEEIYSEIDLENYLHERFNTKEQLLKIGIKEYILNSIYGYDESLNGYLSVNTELLSDLEKQFNKIINKWDEYNNIAFEELLDITSEFVLHNQDCNYTTTELSYYLRYALEIEWSKEYEEFMNDDEIMSGEQFYELTFKNPNLKDKKVLIQYKKYIKNYIKNRTLPVSDAFTKIKSKN